MKTHPRIMSWRPDTCTCIVEYVCDDPHPISVGDGIEQGGEGTYHALSATPCARHASLRTPQAIYEAVVEEQRHMNQVKKHAGQRRVLLRTSAHTVMAMYI